MAMALIEMPVGALDFGPDGMGLSGDFYTEGVVS